MRYRRRFRRAIRRSRYRRRSIRRRSRLVSRRRRFGRRRGWTSYKRRGVITGVARTFTNAQVPDALLVKLKYIKGLRLEVPNDNLSTNSGISIGGYMNDPYDPDPNVGNDSAQGFDFWRDYYFNYIVTRADIEVTFTNHNTFNGAVGYVQPQFQNQPVGLLGTTPLQTIRNYPRLRWVTMGSAGANNAVRRVRTSWSIRKDAAWLPRSSVWEGSGYSAGTAASPANRRQLNIWIGTDNGLGANTSVIVDAVAKITYYCRFYNRKNTPEVLDPE